MGHRVSTLSDRSCVGVGAGSPAVSRAFLLAMIITVAAASVSSSALPSSSTAAAASCCFVAAEPRGAAEASAAGASGGSRKRPRGGGSMGAAAAATDVGVGVGAEPFASGGGEAAGSRIRRPVSSSSLWLFRRNSDNEPSDGTSKNTGGIPISSYSWRRQRPTAGKGRYSHLTTRRRKPQDKAGEPVRAVDNMPPHLAAAFGTSARTENGELILDDEEYERRKLEWAQRYTDVSTLRSTFGTNRNELWGDLDPEATRRLYHTLLPRALMGLYDMGLMRPHELAPLAYEARNAAKKYARERCVVPGRVLSMAFDGFRSLRDYGKWNPEGLSWDQIWDKYEAQVIDEFDFEDHEEDELTKQICLRILERSCRTNTAVDKMLLGKDSFVNGRSAKSSSSSSSSSRNRHKKEQMEMAGIRAKLERDVHELLFEGAQKSVLFEPTQEQRRKLKAKKREIKREEVASRKELRATEKAFLRALRNEEKRKRQKESEKDGDDFEECDVESSSQVRQCQDEDKKQVRLTRQEVWFLRTIVGTKKKIRSIRSQTPLIRKLRGTTGGEAATGDSLVEVSAPVGRAKKMLEITNGLDGGRSKSTQSSSSAAATPGRRRPKRWLGRGTVLPSRKNSVHPAEEEVLTPR